MNKYKNIPMQQINASNKSSETNIGKRLTVGQGFSGEKVESFPVSRDAFKSSIFIAIPSANVLFSAI